MTTIFGERLLHLRKARGLTQKKLAQMLFVSPTAISHYEHDLDEPCYGKPVHLAQFLRTTTDFLLGLTDCEQDPITPLRF